MKKNNKKNLIILAIIGFFLIIIGMFFMVFNKEQEISEPKEEQTPSNKEEIFDDEHKSTEEEEISIKNFKISGNLEYTIELDVINNSDVDYENLNLNVSFKRDDGSVFYDYLVIVGPLKKGETKHMVEKTYNDFTSAVDYEFFVIKN